MISVGLYSFGVNTVIDKFYQIMKVIDKITKDSRFQFYLVIDGSGVADKDLLNKYKDYPVIDLRNIHINDTNLDWVFVIEPYSRPYIPYSEWKVRIVYKEYGVAGCEANAGYLINKQVSKYASLVITDNEYMRDKYVNRYPDKDILVASPAFDHYYSNNNMNSDSINVLWTPHHSIESKTSYDNILGGTYSTFLSYKYCIIEYVTSHSNINLYIKYHPLLPKRYNYYCKHYVVSDSWKQFVSRASTCDRVHFCDGTSDYHDLFNSCDILLNDSISFLQEWLPTMKPMIVLRDSSSSKFSEYGEHLISSCYYQSNSCDELISILSDIKSLTIKHGRQIEVNKVLPYGVDNSEVIIYYLSR